MVQRVGDVVVALREADTTPYGLAVRAGRISSELPAAEVGGAHGDEQDAPPAGISQALVVGSLSEPAFTDQPNGALRRLARSGHEVTDIKFTSEGRQYSALVLYHPCREMANRPPI